MDLTDLTETGCGSLFQKIKFISNDDCMPSLGMFAVSYRSVHCYMRTVEWNT